MSKLSLEEKMKSVERLLLDFIRGTNHQATLSSIPGKYDLYPSSWYVQLTVPTDKDRDRLMQVWSIERKLRELLHQVDYPVHSIMQVRLIIQSDETRQREWEKHGLASIF